VQVNNRNFLYSPAHPMSKPVPEKHFHIARGGAQGIDSGPLAGAVVAIGNFDGVHRGHRAVIGAALTRARKLGRKAAALTFTPHPRLFLRPQETLFELSSERDKLRLLAATGLDALGIGGAAIGFDFHFGKSRAGSPSFLAEQGARLGFAVDVAPPLEDEGRPVSSGAVRAALAAGRVVEATELLGAPWFVSGEVIHGDKRGRELGFPTANLKLNPTSGLKHGIYAVRIAVAGKHHEGVASFGRRPMFDDGAPLLEVFLFDFDGDLYGRAIDVAFIGWIRHEQKFESIEALKRHMTADVAQARDALKRAGNAFPALGDI
jgi:riboflavin kinase/FMN adenylyltransferase